MLNGKVVVVTGGAGVLGSAFCRGIADAGGKVVVADLDIEAARRLAEELTKAGGHAMALQVDICSTDSVDTLIEDATARFGAIDAVVSSAYPHNPAYGSRFEDVTFSNFCENVNLHLGGYFLVAQRFALYFKQQGTGNVISLASIYATLAPRFDVYAGTEMTMPVEYAAIKAGIVQLTRYMARYFQSSSVRFNCISPGGILGGQAVPFLEAYRSFCASKGMLDAEDVVGTLLFLLSDEAKYVNGQNLVIDDGYSI